MFGLLCCAGAGYSIPLSLSESSFVREQELLECQHPAGTVVSHRNRCQAAQPPTSFCFKSRPVEINTLSNMLHCSVISEQNLYQPVTLSFKNAVSLSNNGKMVLYSIPRP